MTSITIRAVTQSDVPGIRPIVDATLFPAELLDDMIAPYLGAEGNTDIWFAALDGDALIGVGFCEAERMTQGTWNLLAIAVSPECQSKGVGAALMGWLEALLAARGERVLIVETSGLPAYERTRAFYTRLGYVREACIRDFYQPGEDKIVFWKALNDQISDHPG